MNLLEILFSFFALQKKQLYTQTTTTTTINSMAYEEAVKDIWRPLAQVPLKDETDVLQELVRSATLAPSSHNTQCWKFRTSKETITLLPDWDRRCPVVDPDDHHLFVTLGCAVENLVQAARAQGIKAVVDAKTPKEGITIDLRQSCVPEATPLFQAIPNRECTRTEYDGHPLASEELKLLEEAGTGNGVRIVFLTDEKSKESVLEWIEIANTAQMNDTKFKNELEEWIRFNDKDAVATGDGLSGKSTGNPSAPKWLGHWIFKFVLRPGPENEKIRRQVSSSAGIAMFVSEHDDVQHWVEAGRCYERFALQATALGIKNAFLNMPVEVTEIRSPFARAMGLSGDARPDLLVRFGRAPDVPHSLRRPLDDVIVE